MKIESLYIEDLWKLKQLHVTFPEPETDYFDRLKISVLVGENGTGKTSLLKFLSGVFYYPYLYGQGLQKGYQLNYSVSGRSYRLDESKPFHSREFEGPAKVIVSTHSLFESFTRNQPNQSSEIEYVYLSPVNKSGKSSLAVASLPILKAFYGEEASDANSAQAVRSLLELIGYTEQPAVEVRVDSKGLKTAKAQRLNDYHLRVGLRTDQTLVNTRRILPKDLSAEWWQDLLEVSNEGHDIVQSLWFPKNGEWIHLSEMSSGELTMFNRFFPLIQAMKDHALVLIDEPETHLHPRWIQQYIHMLARLFGAYDAHILLATHSPLIASDVPRECIVGLLHAEDGRIETYEVEDTTLGGSATEILQAVFRVEEAYGRFSAEAIQRIRAELDRGELAAAMSIYRDLSTTPEKFALYRELKPYLERE